MKKFFSVLAALILFFSVQAQIVINYGDMPVAGTVVTQTTDTAPSGTLPVFTTGANISWDFTALNNQVPNGFAFVDPTTTPYYSYFPSSNLCYLTLDSMFGYIYANSSYVVTQGARAMMDTIEIIMNYEPDDTLFVFPYTMGTTFESHPVGVLKLFYGDSIDLGMGNVYIDSIRMTLSYDKTTVVDGWGNVTTPMGTYPVLRSTRTEIEQQEIAIHYMSMWIPVDNTTDTSLIIEWSMKNTGVPLISVSTNASDSLYSSVDWLTVSPSFGVNEMTVSNTISVYPNPAQNEIRVSFNSEPAGNIIITDVCGREMMRMITEHENDLQINIDGLESGIYFINATDQTGARLTGRFIKQ